MVLLTIDTWRGDHFGAERAGEPLTPALGRFAGGGVTFTRAYSVGNETSPGTAGILTGLLPRRSGVVANVHVLPAGVPTLATRLRAEGFATAGVVSNPVLGPGMGFDQGFDSYEMVPPADRIKARGDAVTDAALRRLDAMPEDRRLFLWVHYLDPHGPYLPPGSAAGRFPVEAFGPPREVPLLPADEHSGLGGVPGYQQRGLSPVPRDARDYVARYAGEVRFMDGEVGRFLDGLAARGMLDSSVVVVTSDHGEAMVDEHGFYFSHANGLTEDQLHVPLVVRCPACPAGKSVEEPVSTVDVVPTVLARLGLPLPGDGEMDGGDLLDPGDEGARRPVYSQSPRQLALRDGDWKVVWKRRADPLLYRVTDDPGELRDLARRHPERLAALVARLRQIRALPVLAHPTVRDETPEATREQLKALGYL